MPTLKKVISRAAFGPTNNFQGSEGSCFSTNQYTQ